MTYSEPARPAVCRTQSLASLLSSAVPTTGITIYGCGRDEAALGRAGVEFICTRSVGFDHIDVQYARSVGVTVGNVAYSPDSVADYTLMLMLMVLRDAKSIIRRTDAHDYRLGDVRGKELRDL